MGKGNVEYKLRRAVKHATPDMKEQVLAKCRAVKQEDAPIVFRTPRNKRIERIYALVAAAAVILLMFNIGLDVYSASVASRVMTVVDIDVNPSIELKINQDDRIVSVRAINEDAVAILDGMDLKGTQTKVAVNAIMGSMFEHGYLQGTTDSVLVSVSNKDANKSEEIQSNITGDIDSLMKAYSRDVSVIGQTIYEGDPELINLSNTYGISEGKAALINKIIEYNDIYTFEDLVSLNITELNEIICSMESMEDDPESPINDDPEEIIEPIIGEPSQIVPEEPEEIIPEETPSVSENATVSGNEISITEDDPEAPDEMSVSENGIDEGTDIKDKETDKDKDKDEEQNDTNSGVVL